MTAKLGNLVSPPGEDVKQLQQLLAGADRHGYDADPGPVTGVFTGGDRGRCPTREVPHRLSDPRDL
jgi:peptidoglycan hydrolase-like protein with peptidoglycan-binding domain